MLNRLKNGWELLKRNYRLRNMGRKHKKKQSKRAARYKRIEQELQDMESGTSGTNGVGFKPQTYRKRLQEVYFKNKVKLILSKELISEITLLHSKIGALEWSGPLFYEVLNGDLGAGYSDMVIKAHHVYPMDIGTSAFTEYSFGPKLLDAYDANPALENMKIGHIHTHHTMNTFFSGTDTDELHENAHQHNYYLSLIVNIAGKYCAKIAFIGESDRNFVYYRGDDKQARTIQSAEREEVLGIIDCDIVFEQPEYFNSQLEDLLKAPSRGYRYSTSGGGYSRDHGYTGYANQNASVGVQSRVPARQDTLFDEDDDYTGYGPAGPYARPWNKPQNSVYNSNGSTPSSQGAKSTGNTDAVIPINAQTARHFMGKLLALDVLSETNYLTTLRSVNVELMCTRPQEGLDIVKLDLYMGMLEDNFHEISKKFFGDRLTQPDLDKLAELCIDSLKDYQDIPLAEELTDFFATYLTEEVVKDISSQSNIN